MKESAKGQFFKNNYYSFALEFMLTLIYTVQHNALHCNELQWTMLQGSLMHTTKLNCNTMQCIQRVLILFLGPHWYWPYFSRLNWQNYNMSQMHQMLLFTNIKNKRKHKASPPPKKKVFFLFLIFSLFSLVVLLSGYSWLSMIFNYFFKLFFCSPFFLFFFFLFFHDFLVLYSYFFFVLFIFFLLF